MCINTYRWFPWLHLRAAYKVSENVEEPIHYSTVLACDNRPGQLERIGHCSKQVSVQLYT